MVSMISLNENENVNEGEREREREREKKEKGRTSNIEYDPVQTRTRPEGGSDESIGMNRNESE
jgi:hypothetical protein